jgi:hypothetical protein
MNFHALAFRDESPCMETAFPDSVDKFHDGAEGTITRFVLGEIPPMFWEDINSISDSILSNKRLFAAVGLQRDGS